MITQDIREERIDNLPQQLPSIGIFQLGDLPECFEILRILPVWNAERSTRFAIQLLSNECDPQLELSRELICGLTEQVDGEIQSNLVQEVMVEPDQAIGLAFDPTVLLDYSETEHDTPIETWITLQIDEIDPDAPNKRGPQIIKVPFTLVPFPLSYDDIELSFRSQTPNGVFDYPHMENLSLKQEIGVLVVTARSKFKYFRPFRASLTISAQSIKGNRQLAVGLATGKDGRDIREGCIAWNHISETLLIDSAHTCSTFPVCVLLGEGENALPEPVGNSVSGVEITVKMLDPTGDEIKPCLKESIEFQSPQGPAKVLLDIESTSQFSYEYSISNSPDNNQVVPVTLQPKRLRAARLGQSISKAVLEVRCQLIGHLDDGQLINVVATYHFDSGNGAADRSDPLSLETESAGSSYNDKAIVQMGAGQRQVIIRLLADVSGMEGSSTFKEPVSMGTASLRIVLSDSTGHRVGEMNISRLYELEPPATTRYLAIDLGTSSIAAALSVNSALPEIIPLGEVLSVYDHQHDEIGGRFISSTVGLGLDDAWRGKVFGPSLWAYMGATSPLPDAKSVASRLGRSYSVAVPLAPASGLGTTQGPVLVGPKILLMEPSGRVTVPRAVWRNPDKPVEPPLIDKSVLVQDLVSDILHELGDLYIPWAGFGEEAYGANVVLTHPNLYSREHENRLHRAAAALCDRLGSDRNKLRLVAESDAAAAYFFKHREDEDISDRPLHLLVFDLGAGTLDITLAKAQPINQVHGPQFGQPEVLRRVGASVGGDAIDIVLFFIIDKMLRKLEQHPSGMIYKHSLVTPSETSPEPDRSDHLSAKWRLAREIRLAKADLVERCRVSTDGHNAYHWLEGECFVVKVGDINNQPRRWPVQQTPGGGLPTIELAAGVILERRGENDIVLSLTKAQVQHPAMQQLMSFMTRTVLEKTFYPSPDDISESTLDRLLVSGRAAMWPLVYEGLEQTRRDLMCNARFTHPQPPTADSMKYSIVFGAIEMARDQVKPDEALEPPHVGLLMWQPDPHRGIQVLNWIPITDEEQTVEVNGIVSVMHAPPGLTRKDLIHDPWAHSLLMPTGQEYEVGDLGRRIQVKRILSDGQPILRLGDVCANLHGCNPLRSPSLYAMNYDVDAKRDAPPGF